MQFEVVSYRPAAPKKADIDLAADVFLSNNPSRGGYRGMNVPGVSASKTSCFNWIFRFMQSSYYYPIGREIYLNK